jgi:effector-binding domain-containing protein
MLHRQHVVVEGQVAEARDRLARIDTWLRQLDREKTMTDYTVVLKTIPAVRIASRRVTIPTNDQVPAYLAAAYDEVSTYVTHQGARATGACFALWHQPAAVHAGEIAEAVLPIDRQVPGTERIAVYELPPTQVAAAVHQGAFENFTRVHATLLDWVEANGYRIVGPYREIYIQHSPGTMADSATEIQYPVEKAL